MRRTWGARFALFGASAVIGATVLAGATSPAGANDDLDKYQGDKKDVDVQATRSYENNKTTFTFTLQATENVSHVLLMACPGIDIESATGPQGANKKDGGEPKQDSSIKDADHVGIKFEPGVPGPYTIVFIGEVLGAEFVVKDGDGHQHFRFGTVEQECQRPAAQQPPSTPTGEGGNPPSNNPPSNNPPSNNPPSNNPASNQPGQSGTEVAGATQNKPGSDVLGDQLTAPEAQAALPRTGLPVPALASIGTMLLGLGGLATALGRRPRG